LSIDRPRRIFRPEYPRLHAKGRLAAGGIGVAAAVAGVAFAMLPDRTEPSSRVLDVVSAGPAEVAVVDGATLKLRDRVVLLQGVAPPTRGAPCAGRDDCGSAAADALAALVRDAAVTCEVHGADRRGRPLGVCQAKGAELGRALLATRLVQRVP
jgi:endonuclease YncB( thermonuclease family)